MVPTIWSKSQNQDNIHNFSKNMKNKRAMTCPRKLLQKASNGTSKHAISFWFVVVVEELWVETTTHSHTEI